MSGREWTSKELQILANKARVMCSLIGCVLVQTSYAIALAFSPVGVLTMFDSHRHHEHGALIAGVCLETSPFKRVAAFLVKVVGKIWDGQNLCCSSVHLFSGLMKMLAHWATIHFFNILHTHCVAFFCELLLITTVKHEQLCKSVSFRKNYSSVWYIYFFQRTLWVSAD